MKYTIYVLFSKIKRKSCVGLTNDLSRRLEEHNNGESFYTKAFRPWEVFIQKKLTVIRRLGAEKSI